MQIGGRYIRHNPYEAGRSSVAETAFIQTDSRTGADAGGYCLTTDVCLMAGNAEVAAAVTFVTITSSRVVRNQAITLEIEMSLIIPELYPGSSLNVDRHCPLRWPFSLCCFITVRAATSAARFPYRPDFSASPLMCSYSRCSLLPTPRRCFLPGGVIHQQ